VGQLNLEVDTDTADWTWSERREMARARLRFLLTAAAALAATASPDALFERASMNVYFGSLAGYGVDTRESGRSRQEFERARIVQGMDFLAMTSPTDAASVSAIAASLNTRLAGRFVAMYGWQYGATSHGSHVNVLEPSELRTEHAVPDSRYDLFYRSWLPQQMDTTGSLPIVQFAEPGDPDVDYGRRDVESLEGLRAITAPYVRTIQIARASYREANRGSASETRWRPYLNYLNAGFRVAPTADWDPPPRRGTSVDQRTAVLAPRLSKLDLLDAIRARRVYASDDPNLKVSFSINQHPMGSVVPMPSGTPLRIELTFSDRDEPGASYWLSLRRDTPGGELEAASELSGTDFRGDGTVVFTQFRHTTGEEHFLAHVVQEGANGVDHVWTAPIWIVPPREANTFPRASR
jgi:hypothetical protein